MLKLAHALPKFADELSNGLAALGYKKLAESVYAVDIAERCRCDEPGCVTFHAVPKISAPSGEACERVIAPAMGVICVQYFDQHIIWVEVLGRPDDREKLDRFEFRLAATESADQVLDTEPRIGRFRICDFSCCRPVKTDD